MALDCDLPNGFDCSNAKDPNFVSVRLPEEVRLWLLDHAISNQLVRANKPNMGGAIISAIRKYIKVCGGEDSSGQTLNFFTEKIAGSLGIDKGITLSNILDAIANLQESKELAQLAAEGHSESLSAIAAQLGVGFNGDVQTIFSAIHRLKLRAVNDDSECYRAVDLLDAIANALGYEYVDSPKSKDTLLGAIANLKHSLELSQKEVEALQKSRQREDHWREKYNELQVLYDQAWQDSDLSELRSERDYYRSILDNLCDRLNVPNIEALEHAAKYQEMDLDFTAQYNDDLRGKLVTSQAMNLGYLNRIVELENEVRSLKEPLPERDRLTNAELIQLVKNLLKQV